MAYVTPEEFREYALSEDALIDFDDIMIATAAEKASSVADSYLRKRKTLPLIEPYDEALKDCVCSLMARRLFRRRGFNPAAGTDTEIVTAYAEAIEWLESVSSGAVEIGGLDSTPETEEAGTLSDSECIIDFSYFTRTSDFE